MASTFSVFLRLAGRSFLSTSKNKYGLAAGSVGWTCGTDSVANLSTGLHKLPPLKTKAAVTYGGRYTVTLIPGTGVGPEMAEHVKYLFQLAGVPVDFETVNIESEHDYNVAVKAIRRNGVGLKGNMFFNTNLPQGKRSKNVSLRTELDLFADIVHCKSLPGLKARHKEPLDIVIIRENTEGEYAGLEHQTVPGVIESLKVITRKKSMRIAEFAFEFAKLNNRKKVTAVHKANIMKMGDGLFLECCREVSKNYPSIEFEGMIVDNTSMQLVSKPHQFDLMVCPNLYGNIVSSIVCGLTGGSGLAAGINIGDKHALFEQATRNTGKTLVGKNEANPVFMINASTSLLNYLGLGYHADVIESSFMETLAKGIRTKDIFGTATTSEFIDSVAGLIKQKSALK